MKQKRPGGRVSKRKTLPIGEGLCLMLGVLLFHGAGVNFPGVAVTAQGDLAVGALQRDIITAVVVAAEFEQLSDPETLVIALQAYLKVQGQLGGYDVAGDGQQVSIFGVISKHDHVVHPEGQLGEVLADFAADDTGIVELIPERGPDAAADGVGGAGKAIAGAQGQ